MVYALVDLCVGGLMCVQFLHSECGMECGYILDGQRLIWNPMDDILTKLSEVGVELT